MDEATPWEPGARDCPTCRERTPCGCCQLWTGQLSPGGYGLSGVRTATKGHVYAHRLAYEQRKGPIPRGMMVVHLCDQRACCYPPHLNLGTHADNMRDAYLKGRVKPPNPFVRLDDDDPCPQGHSGIGNFYTRSNGKRECRICRREHVRRWKQRSP